MSIISVPNLKQSKHEKVILTQLKYICNFCVKKRKNVKKIKQFTGTNISRNAEAISFNFDM